MGSARLPLFNPDLEADLPAPVRRLHAAIQACDALLIASPEYAHGVTGVLKNALDWLVSFEGFVDKPVAIFNASPRSLHAEPALREVLTTMSAMLMPDACLRLPLRGTGMSEQDMVDSPHAAAIRAALTRLARGIPQHMKWIVLGLVVVIAVAVGAWWYEGYRAESALLAQPVYRVLKKHERALFDELAAEYRVYQRDEERRSSSSICQRAHQRDCDARAGECLAGVGAGAGAGHAGHRRARCRASQGTPVFDSGFRKVAGPPDIAQSVDAGVQAHTLDLMAEVIRSAAENPVAQPAPER